MKLQKNLVNTPGADGVVSPITYMRDANGSIDFAAYKGLEGEITQNNLTINVVIKDARIRYGHLDLCVTPVAGSGNVWVERKNIVIPEDKSTKKKAAARSSKIAKKEDSFVDPNTPMSTEQLRLMIKAMVLESTESAARGTKGTVKD